MTELIRFLTFFLKLIVAVAIGYCACALFSSNWNGFEWTNSIKYTFVIIAAVLTFIFD